MKTKEKLINGNNKNTSIWKRTKDDRNKGTTGAIIQKKGEWKWKREQLMTWQDDISVGRTRMGRHALRKSKELPPILC